MIARWKRTVYFSPLVSRDTSISLTNNPYPYLKRKKLRKEEKKKTVDAAKLSEKLRYRVIECRMFMQGITPAWIPTLSLDLYRYFFRLLDWKIPLIIEHRTTRSLLQIMERWILILCFNLVATRPIRFLPLRGEDQGMLRIQD